MNIFDSEIAYLVVVANAVLLTAASLAILKFTHQSRKLLEFWRSPTGTAVAAETAESAAVIRLLKMAARLERRVADLQTQVERLSRRPEKTVQPNVRPLPIDNAARMARSGASVEELTRTCGLNLGEARLLRQLHARRSTAAGT